MSDSTAPKKFRLKKEILNYSSGFIIPTGEEFELLPGTNKYQSKNGWMMSKDAIQLKDWFEVVEPVEQVQDEKIIVQDVRTCEFGIELEEHTFLAARSTLVRSNLPIPSDKWGIIKEATQSIVNNEPLYTKEDLAKEIIKATRKKENHLIEPTKYPQLIYTQEQMDTAIRDAFNAAREYAPTREGHVGVLPLFYKDVQDYLTHKNSTDLPSKQSLHQSTAAEKSSEKKEVGEGEKRDWEVVEYDYAGSIYRKNVGHFFSEKYTSSMVESQLQELNCKIHSVRRLADSQVFTVGDEVTWDLEKVPGMLKHPFIIKSFEVNDCWPEKRMFCNNQNIWLGYLQKPSTPRQDAKTKPIFVWDDELVFDFINFTFGSGHFHTDMRNDINEFKKSKQQ